MKKETWKEILRIIVTVLTALLTALGAQSCTATMSVFWKNANSQQKSEQSATNKGYRDWETVKNGRKF